MDRRLAKRAEFVTKTGIQRNDGKTLVFAKTEQDFIGKLTVFFLKETVKAFFDWQFFLMEKKDFVASLGLRGCAAGLVDVSLDGLGEADHRCQQQDGV